ncbi:RidA family protein [Vibrio sp. WXL210]|uniref:RidA family protein n=1 Tax=Vibrio sp. WXL210 TaxID=3450709 RepID=UPI003EC62E86
MKVTMKSILFASAMSLSLHAQASGVERHLNEGSTFPIAKAVTLKAGTDIVFLSGTVPPAFDTNFDKGTIEYFGDMEQQTVGVLTSIEHKLHSLGLEMADVVKMQVYLVPDKDTQKSDFAGFMRGYTQFFGTEAQPNLPSRSAFNIHSLANPGWLVEIEVVAAKKG